MGAQVARRFAWRGADQRRRRRGEPRQNARREAPRTLLFRTLMPPVQALHPRTGQDVPGHEGKAPGL